MIDRNFLFGYAVGRNHALPAVLDKYPAIELASTPAATFTDGGADIPLKSLSVELMPRQDLHGHDAPWPAGGSKNILNPKIYSGLSYNPTVHTTVTLTESPIQLTPAANLSKFTVDTTETWRQYSFICPLQGGHHYVFSTKCSSSAQLGTTWGYLTDNGDGTFDVNWNGGASTSASQTFAKGCNPQVDAYLFFVFSNRETKNATLTVDAPMIEEVPSQSSTPSAYVPYENYCPIIPHNSTGVDVFCEGKNRVDLTALERCTLSANGDADSSTIRCTTDYITCLPNTKYVASIETGKKFVAVHYYDEYKNSVSSSNVLENPFTTSAACHLIRVVFGNNDDSTILPSDITQAQVEQGAEATTFETYKKRAYHADLPQGEDVGFLTIGTCNMTTGKVIKEGNLFEFSQLTWTDATVSGVHYYTATIGYMKNSGKRNFWCDRFKTLVKETIYDNPSPDLTITNAYARAQNLNVRYDAIATLADWNAWIVANPVKAARYLAGTEQATDPTDVFTFYGENNIFSPNGNVTVEYRADPKLYVDQRLPEES